MWKFFALCAIYKFSFIHSFIKSVAFVHSPFGVVADEVVGEPFPGGGCAGGSPAPYQGGFVRDLLLTTTHSKVSNNNNGHFYGA